MRDLNNLKITDFAPLWDNVIVRPIKVEEKGKFLRPQNEEDKSELGEVVSVGPAANQFSFGEGEVQRTEAIKVGDLVLFNKYSTTKIDLGEEMLVRAEDIVAVLRNEDSTTG